VERDNLLSHALSNKGQNAFFSFLELCNVAIFHHSLSGLRADYWPQIHSKEDKKTRLYSPTLCSVWDNMPSFTLSLSDWFIDQPIEVMAPHLTMMIPDRFSMTKKWKALTSFLVNLKRD
jgi:hypothetical protein